jgi:hypothetical protein
MNLSRFQEGSPLNGFLDGSMPPTIDRKACLTWLDKTVQENIKNGHEEHYQMGGGALPQLLSLVYNANGQLVAGVDYHLSKRRWKWFDHPFEKTKSIELIMGVSASH